MTVKILRAAFAASLVLAPVAAKADYYYDGGRVNRECNDKSDSFRYAACRGYVVGVVDAFMQTENYGCRITAPKVQIIDVIDITLNYMKAHPERRGEPAAPLIYKAMYDAFCPAN
jgi:hypothetical protein